MDERHQQLTDLADELERAIVSSTITKNSKQNIIPATNIQFEDLHIIEQQDYYKICHRAGWINNRTWKSYNELTWNLDALDGHLPHMQGRYLYPTEGQMTNLLLSSFALTLGDLVYGDMEFLGRNQRPIIHLLAERLVEFKKLY